MMATPFNFKQKVIDFGTRLAFFNAAYAPRTAVEAQVDVVTVPAVATPAIDCTTKVCTKCKVAQPLTAFYSHKSRCKSCKKVENRERRQRAKSKDISLEEKAAQLEAHATASGTATAHLVTFESLTLEARKAKSRRAMYRLGRMRIDAIYNSRKDEVEYSVNGWPCYPDDVRSIFADIHSGHGVRVQI